MTKIIVLEGIDGSGKSTVAKLIQAKLKDSKILVTREPGGNEFAEKIREAIFSKQGENFENTTKILLMAAARNEHIQKTIIPSIQKYDLIVIDRFVDSSYVYQGIMENQLDLTKQINAPIIQNIKIDHKFYLKISQEVSNQRRFNQRETTNNYLDHKPNEYYAKLVKAYDQLAMNDNKFTIIDATKTSQEVCDEILKVINE